VVRAGAAAGPVIPVTHVITGLGRGGTETVLRRLLDGVDRDRFHMRVISLTDGGALRPVIEAGGVEVASLGLEGVGGLPSATVRLRRTLRRQRPLIVQTWMYQADLVGAAAARLAGVPFVAWNLRSSDLAPGAFTRTTRFAARGGARLSRRLPDVVVCGSEAARRFHTDLGYDPVSLVVVPNGFPAPNPSKGAGARLRAALDIGPDDVVVGRVARFHPHKDLPTFVTAAGVVAKRCPHAVFVLCGSGLDRSNPALQAAIDQSGASDRFRCLGERDDIDDLHAMFDVACSSSLGEGFPNVVAEAMASGVPVVATDVGDSALIVGGTGRIVPARDPEALAAALVAYVELGPDERRRLGEAARRRIEEHYSVDAMVGRYEVLYEEMVAGVRHRRSIRA
jgi:glycosyltransferase involved in cell wall biosynthesis